MAERNAERQGDQDSQGERDARYEKVLRNAVRDTVDALPALWLAQPHQNRDEKAQSLNLGH